MTPGKEKIEGGCPRCGQDTYNTFRVKRAGVYMEISKCKVCGFLFMTDENTLSVAAAEVKEMFIQDLRKLGKTTGTDKAKSKEGN